MKTDTLILKTQRLQNLKPEFSHDAASFVEDWISHLFLNKWIPCCVQLKLTILGYWHTTTSYPGVRCRCVYSNSTVITCLKKQELLFEDLKVVVFITTQYQIMIDPTHGWWTQRWQPAAWFGWCIWQSLSGSSTQVKRFLPHNPVLRGCLQLLLILWIVPLIPSNQQRLLNWGLVCGADFSFHASNLFNYEFSSSHTLFLSNQF